MKKNNKIAFKKTQELETAYKRLENDILLSNKEISEKDNILTQLRKQNENLDLENNNLKKDINYLNECVSEDKTISDQNTRLIDKYREKKTIYKEKYKRAKEEKNSMLLFYKIT